MPRIKLHVDLETWPLTAPFRITGYTMESVEVVVVRLESQGLVGRGEAAGVYYRDDAPAKILCQLESMREAIEAGLTRQELAHSLPAGGARNALDCALWDLEAKFTSRPVWEIAGLQCPRPLLTTFTCGADEPEKMASVASGYRGAKAIKVKLTGEPVDAARVRAIRAARHDVWLGVDGNQGFTRAALDCLLPTLVEERVQLIEQPFPVGKDALMDGLHSPIPLAADESAQDGADLEQLVGRYNVVNIKLDKCGGLTEGLAMARSATKLGLKIMIGNMVGTSLAMAPAFLVGQLCEVVDLDGPVFLKDDRRPSVEYVEGMITSHDGLWGYP